MLLVSFRSVVLLVYAHGEVGLLAVEPAHDGRVHDALLERFQLGTRHVDIYVESREKEQEPKSGALRYRDIEGTSTAFLTPV